MQRFEAYEDIGGKWRWRLFAADERIVASSGESFASRAVALRAAEGVRATAPAATISITPGLGIAAALRLRALLASPSKVKARGARRTPAPYPRLVGGATR